MSCGLWLYTGETWVGDSVDNLEDDATAGDDWT